jgi:MATE family, multidrug efflux pump
MSMQVAASRIDNGLDAGRAAWWAEFRATLALSWPLVATNLAQNALLTSNVLLMGWLGPQALAAGALGTNLYFALLTFGIGLVTATSPLVAHEVGRKRHSVREVRRTVRQGLWAALVVAIPITAIAWQAEAILRAMGQEPRLAALAGPYVRMLCGSLVPFLAFLVLRHFLAALGRPGWPMVIGLLAVPLNFVVAWTLMFGHFGAPALGLPGVGVATVVSSTFTLVALIVVIVSDRRLRRYHVFGRFWRLDWPRFRAVWRLGVPIGCTLAFETTVFNAATFLMGRIGADELAAHAVAIQIASFCFMVPFGIGQAVTVRVGRFQGARDPAGVTRAGWTAFVLGVGFMTLTALTMLLAPQHLLGLFLDFGQPENLRVIGFAVEFLLLAAIFQIADGAQAVGAGMLRGLHDTRRPMLFAALGYWGVGLPLGFGLAFGTSLRGIGIWIGLAAGLGVVALLMLHRWANRERLGLVRAAGA